MKIYNVMLEGIVDVETGFFVTIEVAAKSKRQAGSLATIEASKNDDKKLRIEEIEVKFASTDIGSANVVKVYGKSYFPLTDRSDD